MKCNWFCPPKFEMYQNFAQNVCKVSSFGSKHSKRIESLHNIFEKFRNFVHKNFKKFRIWTRKRGKEYVLDPKHSKSISFRPKTFETFLILLQDILKVSKFHPNYAKRTISVYKTFENIVFSNFQRVSNLTSKLSKSIEFLFKIFEKDGNCNQNIRHI